MGLDSTNEDSSTLDMTLARRGLVLMMEEVCLSMKFSRHFTCSIIGLCVKRPLVVMSRHMLASISIPKQKSHSKMLLGKDKFCLVFPHVPSALYQGQSLTLSSTRRSL